jgi:hypothetical protein
MMQESDVLLAKDRTVRPLGCEKRVQLINSFLGVAVVQREKSSQPGIFELPALTKKALAAVAQVN